MIKAHSDCCGHNIDFIYPAYEAVGDSPLWATRLWSPVKRSYFRSQQVQQALEERSVHVVREYRRSAPLTKLWAKRTSLTEVSLKETLECLTVSSLVSSHLVNCVVDCVEILLLSHLSELYLTCCCAVLCVNSELEILLC